MNGRLYDPLIARFISADPIIADPLSVQAFNRYSYVDNNPLTYTDPTGYLKIGRVLRTVVAIAVAVVIMQPQLGIVAALGKFGASVLAGTVAGAISTGTVQGALMGGLSAGLFYAVGPIAAEFGKAASIARVGLSGTVGGMMSVMQGGKFGSGFLAAGFTATISPGLEKIGDIAARIAVAAIAGGVASVIGGGKFENGAITGAFQALFTGIAEEAAKTPKISRPSSSKANYNTPSTRGVGQDTVDIRVNFFPGGANGAGHVGIGVNTDQTVGLYPQDGASPMSLLLVIRPR